MSAPRLDIKINIYTYIIFLLLRTILPNLAYKEEKRLSSFKRKKKKKVIIIKKKGMKKSNEREERKEMGIGIKIVSASRSLRRLEPKP